MWNETEGSLGEEVTISPPPQQYSEYDESSYSIFFGTYNPNSPAYSTNSTDFGVSIGMLKFCVEGVGVTTLSVLGVIGNVLSIIVLSSPKMRNPSSCFLLCLAVSDIVTLIGAILLIGVPSLLAYDPKTDPKQGMFAYNIRVVEYGNMVPSSELFALSVTALSCSIYFTMALTLERYLAVCRPLSAKFLCTWNRATLVSAIIIIFSILYNLPRWWEFTYVVEKIQNFTVCRPVPTAFRMLPVYDTYYGHFAYPIVLFVVPVCFLIAFNILIWRGIKAANNLRRNMSPLTKNDNSLTRMLFGVVAVFLICHLAPTFHAFYRYAVGSRVYVPEAEFLWVFTLMLNSSVNFLIYCTIGAKFREIFRSMFFFWRKESKTLYPASSTKTTYRSSLSQSLSLRSQPLHPIVHNWPASEYQEDIGVKDGSTPPSSAIFIVPGNMQMSTII